MTTPPAYAPVDMSNYLLDGGPAVLTTSVVDTTGGQRLALTIRTTSTTLTVMLGALELRAWAAQLARDAARMAT